MSAASGIIKCLLRLSGASKAVSEKTFYQQMRKNAIKGAKELRAPFFRGVKAEKNVYCGMPYFVFVPEHKESEKCVLYLHGSGYVNHYRAGQLRFAAYLAEHTHAKVYFPVYPKLPFVSVLPCFALLNNFYAFLRKKREVALVGDSSGGALALALSAENESARFVVAVSPWLILPVGEECRQVKTDIMLSLSKLDYASDLWMQGVKGKDVRVSPFFGNYLGKELFLFSGEEELFRPDISRFSTAQSALGVKVTYVEGKEQQHCYPLFPTPEGEEARKRICGELQRFLYGERK